MFDNENRTEAEQIAEQIKHQLETMYETNITEQRNREGMKIERAADGSDEMMLEYHYANPAMPWSEIVECRNNGYDNIAEVASHVRSLMPGSTAADALSFIKNADKWPDGRDESNFVRNLRMQVTSLVRSMATSMAIMEYQKKQLRELTMAMFASHLKAAFGGGEMRDFKRDFGNDPFDFGS